MMNSISPFSSVEAGVVAIENDRLTSLSGRRISEYCPALCTNRSPSASFSFSETMSPVSGVIAAIEVRTVWIGTALRSSSSS